MSGIELRGDAWKWWNAAAGQYQRGSAPRVASVLVFRQQPNMRHGHVAVVTKVVNSRKILIDHANWAPFHSHDKGQVSRGVAVIDVSPHNDWTQVRVWHAPAATFGTRVNPTYGFIYSGHDHVTMASFEMPGMDEAPAPKQMPAVARVAPAPAPTANSVAGDVVTAAAQLSGRSSTGTMRDALLVPAPPPPTAAGVAGAMVTAAAELSGRSSTGAMRDALLVPPPTATGVAGAVVTAAVELHGTAGAMLDDLLAPPAAPAAAALVVAEAASPAVADDDDVAAARRAGFGHYGAAVSFVR